MRALVVLEFQLQLGGLSETRSNGYSSAYFDA